jgi:diadenylate cyclase
LTGLVVVILASLVAVLLKLPALSYLIRLFSAALFFCFVLIFQPEIRDALERIGNSRFVNPLSDTLPQKKLPAAKQVVDETVDAVFKMSEENVGALIVFEGLTRLGDVAESGKIVDAKVTSHMIRTIFHDKTPLHDGALIVRDMRLWKASCVLPSTKSQMDFGNMGTRHRAAVGITEVSDSLVVVVSEQTGRVSVAQDGRLVRGLNAEELRDILMTYIAGSL